MLEHLKEQDQIEKRFWVLKGPLQMHPLWLHKDERLVSLVLVLMIALLIYCLLEYLVRQAQRQLTGRTLLEPLPITPSSCCALLMAARFGRFQN